VPGEAGGGVGLEADQAEHGGERVPQGGDVPVTRIGGGRAVQESLPGARRAASCTSSVLVR
jgi:hypothetical protein